MVWYKVYNDLLDFWVDDVDLLSPIEAAKIAVIDIQKKYSPPYNLLFSGGIDSQAMVYAWLLYGENYKIVTYRYNNDLNYYDYKNAESFCQYFNVPITYKDFDLLTFLQSKYKTVSKEFKCSSPQICTHIEMVSDLEGTIIFGGDFLSISGPRISRAILGLYNASLSRPNIIPYFLLHTPELAYSPASIVLTTEEARDRKRAEFHKTNVNEKDYNIKIQLYKKGGFKIIPQEEKYSGFEGVKDLYDKQFKTRLTWKDRIKYSNRPAQRTFDLLLRYPYEVYGDENIPYRVNKEIFLKNIVKMNK